MERRCPSKVCRTTALISITDLPRNCSQATASKSGSVMTFTRATPVTVMATPSAVSTSSHQGRKVMSSSVILWVSERSHQAQHPTTCTLSSETKTTGDHQSLVWTHSQTVPHSESTQKRKEKVNQRTVDSKRELDLQKAFFNQDVDTKKAETQLAYELQAAKEQKGAHCFGQERQKIKTLLIAQAEAEKIKMIRDVEMEASIIEAIGKAEAEKLRLKADAYQQYGEAAKTALVLEALPKIASKVTAPLVKIDEIVNCFLAELPVSVNALTGVDLSKIPLLQMITAVSDCNRLYMYQIKWPLSTNQ
uniref:Flotillin n=1 Tax=Seriola lalandi dorsalis TaxID=1841481 RepID=A0A3B4YH51_SERLL